MKNNAPNRPYRTAFSAPSLCLCLLAALALAFTPMRASAAPLNRVLILDEFVSGGIASEEAVFALSLGLAVDIATAAQWSSIPATGLGGPTGFGFNQYRAIILGDPDCGTSAPGYATALSVLNATKLTWGPQVTGNVILEGVDNALHSPSQVGATKTLERGIQFAIADATQTGLYYALSCYYDYTAPATVPTLVPHLTTFGTFMVRNYPGVCFNLCHQVATHPVFTAAPALTDAELSNWGCSTHEGFDVWPANFVVLAIALTNGTFNASDGSQGVPYILVRGKDVTVISTIHLGPPIATNALNTPHTVCATVTNNSGPVVGTTVTFTIVSGPNAPLTGTAVTGPGGVACFTWTGNGGPGTDLITSSWVNALGVTNYSETVQKIWEGGGCLTFGREVITCLSNNCYRWRVSITNNFTNSISYVSFPSLPPGVTVQGGPIVALPTPVPAGGSFTLDVTICFSGTAAHDLCFTIAVHNETFAQCCATDHCITLPECCGTVLKESIKHLSGNNYSYCFQWYNETTNTISYLYLVGTPAGSPPTFSPPIVPVNIPPFTTSTTICVNVTAPPGTWSFIVSAHDSGFRHCCSRRRTALFTPIIIIDPTGDGTVSGGTVSVAGTLGTTLTSVRDMVREVSFDLDGEEVGHAHPEDGSFSFSLQGVAGGTHNLLATVEPVDGDLDILGASFLRSFTASAGTPDGAAVALPKFVNGKPEFRFAPPVGTTCWLEYTDSLNPTNWKLLRTINGTGSVITVQDTSGATQRFYRVRY